MRHAERGESRSQRNRAGAIDRLPRFGASSVLAIARCSDLPCRHAKSQAAQLERVEAATRDRPVFAERCLSRPAGMWPLNLDVS